MREQRKWAQQIVPPESRYEVRKTRNCSGKFPCGTVTGARPCFSPSELSALAELKLNLPGRGINPVQWDVPLTVILFLERLRDHPGVGEKPWRTV